MEKGLRMINNTIIKIFSILIGIPLAFAGTIVVLSMWIVDLALLLLPVFWICNIVFEDVIMIVVPNSIGLQFVFTIIGTLMGYYLQKILKVYTPRWFKGVETYVKNSFIFY